MNVNAVFCINLNPGFVALIFDLNALTCEFDWTGESVENRHQFQLKSFDELR